MGIGTLVYMHTDNAPKRDVWNEAPTARSHAERMAAATATPPPGEEHRLAVFVHGDSLTAGYTTATSADRANRDRARRLRPPA